MLDHRIQESNIIAHLEVDSDIRNDLQLETVVEDFNRVIIDTLETNFKTSSTMLKQ